MIARLLQPVKRAAAAATAPPSASSPVAPYSNIAVIVARDCLAFQGTGCSICVERCPVPGALVLHQGLPQVEPVLCSGCRVCHEVCPAPGFAVRILPRPPDLPPPNAPMAVPHSPFPVLRPTPHA